MSCLIIGDSIAKGVSYYFPQCTQKTQVGINSKDAINKFRIPDLADCIIISLGANDSTNTYKTLLPFRASLKNKKIVWLVPSNNEQARVAVFKIATQFRDQIIDIRPFVSKDKIHPVSSGPLLKRFHDALTAAIQARLGLPYRWRGTGPGSYDCSGFVWKTFNEAGVNFTRDSARGYWKKFDPATEEEKFQFGTLVFFNRLTHVGIVVDENGFYHSAKHHGGVSYAEFNKYWLSRIDGFRRVSIDGLDILDSSADIAKEIGSL